MDSGREGFVAVAAGWGFKAFPNSDVPSACATALGN